MVSANVTSALTPDVLIQHAKHLNLRFSAWLRDRSFKVTGSSDWEAVEVVLTLANEMESYVYPVHARLMYRQQNVSIDQALAFLIEFMESYFEEFFQFDEGVLLPIDWKDYEFEGIDFQLKGQILNRHLEGLADRLLAGETLSPEDLEARRRINH